MDVPAFADAQFVIEAEILPNVREPEGPFAEVTGYYGQRDNRWVMQGQGNHPSEEPRFPFDPIGAGGMECRRFHG